MSITEDAPVQVTSPQPPEQAPQTTVAWWWLVAASLLLLAVAGVTLAVWWAFTRETRTTTYRVLGDVNALRLDVGDADVEIDGGATAIEVRQVDRFAFRPPENVKPAVENGTVSISAGCPEQVVGSCKQTFHLTVPDNVPLDIETASGTVRLRSVRASVQVSTGSGDVQALGFCGFSLTATSDSGDVGVRSECSADRLELRSRTGDVTATVPPGRYAVDAQSGQGGVRTRGINPVRDAGFEIQAMSTTGDVTVEASS